MYKDGISVSIITPGGFKTDLCKFDKIFAYMQHVLSSLKPEVQQHYGKDYVTSRKCVFCGRVTCFFVVVVVIWTFVCSFVIGHVRGC